MRNINSLKYTALAALSVGIVACSGDDSSNNSNNNTNNQTGSLQQQGVDNGQIEFTDGSGITLMDTLAVDVGDIAAPATALPSGFDNANYYGAVDPSASTGWWEGWTAIDPAIDGSLPGAKFHPLQAEIEGGTITGAETSGCAGLGFTDGGTVDVFGVTFPVCVLPARITSDVTLPNNHVFVYENTVNVGMGDSQLEGGAPTGAATLTISAGTQIYASKGTPSSLVITRGSKIDAQGTADEPIIFAAVDYDGAASDVITGDPTDLTGRADWGGVVLAGLGMENSGDANGELLTEAAPTDQERWFGGTNNGDNSGTIRYAIIAESGFEFRPDAEVQGLTLEAVGNGTTLEYIQVLASEDDCVEWFGGAANMKYLVCAGVDDDALDMDEGYVGNIQFVLVRMGSSNGNYGIESDNNGGNFEQTPATAPNIANLTVLGNSGKDETAAALHREGFRGKVFRSVYTDDSLAGGSFALGCLDIDDVLPAELQYRDVVFNCSAASLVEDSD